MNDRAPRRVDFLKAAVKDLDRLTPVLRRVAIGLVRDVSERRLDGEPLHSLARAGDLGDCRKIYFGVGQPASHRIVFRLLDDGSVEVVEVVAIEAREDAYVYLLASIRLGRLPSETRPQFDRLHQRLIAERGQRDKPDRP